MADNDKLSRYDEIRTEADRLYKTFGKVACPALQGKSVHFISEGFNHLIYRIPKQERDRSVQIMRFELLQKAKQLIELSTTIQEFESYPKEVSVKRHKRTVREQVQIHDIGLVGIIKGFRLKVVIRKIGNGAFKFHSVIPAWSTQYYRDIKLVRNTKGNVAED